MCSPGQDRLEFCPCQSLYFYVNIVARRLEQVPAGNLSEEHATRRVGMCLSSVGSCRLTTLHDSPLLFPSATGIYIHLHFVHVWHLRIQKVFGRRWMHVRDVYGLARWRPQQTQRPKMSDAAFAASMKKKKYYYIFKDTNPLCQSGK